MPPCAGTTVISIGAATVIASAVLATVRPPVTAITCASCKRKRICRAAARATSSITPESMSASPWTTQTRSTPSICESDNSMPDNVRRPLLTVRAASTKLCPCGVNSIPDALCVRHPALFSASAAARTSRSARCSRAAKARLPIGSSAATRSKISVRSSISSIKSGAINDSVFSIDVSISFMQACGPVFSRVHFLSRLV